MKKMNFCSTTTTNSSPSSYVEDDTLARLEKLSISSIDSSSSGSSSSSSSPSSATTDSEDDGGIGGAAAGGGIVDNNNGDDVLLILNQHEDDSNDNDYDDHIDEIDLFLINAFDNCPDEEVEMEGLTSDSSDSPDDDKVATKSPSTFHSQDNPTSECSTAAPTSSGSSFTVDDIAKEKTVLTVSAEPQSTVVSSCVPFDSECSSDCSTKKKETSNNDETLRNTPSEDAQQLPFVKKNMIV